MSRPVDADAQATKRSILEAALALLEESWPPPSTRAVARRAGVSVAIVHHYYGNKKGLMDACIDTMYAAVIEFASEFASKLRSESPPAQVIEEYARESYRFARRHRAVLRLLVLEVAELGGLDPVRKRLTEGPFLAMASDALASELAVPIPEARLRLQTVVSATARYATLSEEDLSKTTGVPVGDALHETVESHLVGLARSLLID
jgi:AcrR family transcriptional regulator